MLKKSVLNYSCVFPESFAKRSEVQDALFKDKKWTKDYVAKVTPLLQSSVR